MTFEKGSPVWVARVRCGQIVHIAATIGSWNALASAYHVIPVDRPDAPFFTSPGSVVERLATDPVVVAREKVAS
jgi:hypothetical protein